MNIVVRHWISGAGGTLMAVAFAVAEPAPAPARVARPLEKAVVAPALRAAAERDGVKLFHLDGVGATPTVGDYTVAWIGTREGQKVHQWLLQIRRGTTTPQEQKSAKTRGVTRYLSWGPVVTFKSELAALDLWIAGPVAATEAPLHAGAGASPPAPGAPAPVRRARLLVPADYLRLGLSNTVRVDEHIRRRFDQIVKEDPAFNLGHIYSLSKPVKPENVAYAKPVAERVGFSPEMERAWAGGAVALDTFYRLADDVPELKQIASVAFDRPPPWKLAKLAFGTLFKSHVGGPDMRPVDPAALGLPPVALEAFDAPFFFKFGDDPITNGAMVVTDPTSPLDTTAGILAVYAVHPHDPARIVQLAMITVQGSPGTR